MRSSRLSGFLGLGCVLSVALHAPAIAQTGGLLCAARDIVAQVDTPGTPTDLAIDGLFAYVADHGRGLLVLDVADPTGPRAVGQLDTLGNARRIAVGGPLALLAEASPYVVRVIDISDPAAPGLLATIDAPSWVFDLAIVGNSGYFSTAAGLHIVDLSDPTSPAQIGLFATAGAPVGFRIVSDIAYLAEGGSGLEIVDISDPRNPVILGAYPVINAADDIEVVDEIAYLADEARALMVLDVSDPAVPTLLNELPITTAAGEIAAEGSLVCVGGHTVISIAEPALPVLLGQYPSGGSAALHDGFEFVAGTHVLVRDLSSPPGSGLLGVAPMDDEAVGIDVEPPFAFVADGSAGLQIVDASDPAAPVRVATLATGGWVHDVVVRDGLAYIVDQAEGFFIADVSDPMLPQLLASLPDVTTASRLDVGDWVACVERLSGGLYIVDVSSPSQPILVHRHYFTGSRGDGGVAVHSGYAFVAHGDLRVFDLSRPTDPPIAQVDLDWAATSVCVQNSIAYLAGTLHFAVFDVSDPENPLEIGSMPLPYGAVDGIDVREVTAFVAINGGDLWAIDISNPASPSLLERSWAWRGGSWPFDVEIDGDRAFVVDLFAGLEILDISDCPPCPADFNTDGTVNTQDFIAFLAAWATERTQDCSAGGCQSDLNDDGTVNTQDFVTFLNLWATGC